TAEGFYDAGMQSVGERKIGTFIPVGRGSVGAGASGRIAVNADEQRGMKVLCYAHASAELLGGGRARVGDVPIVVSGHHNAPAVGSQQFGEAASDVERYCLLGQAQ